MENTGLIFYGLLRANLAGGLHKQQPGSPVPWPSNLKSRNRFISEVDEKGTEAAVPEESGFFSAMA